jgi:demethylspheroidene O-methyltransferase
MLSLKYRLQNRFFAWRDQIVANSRFQRWAAAFPFTRPVASAQSRKLFDLCAGFVYSQVLAACVELDVFSTLAKGPRSVSSLAKQFDLSVEATERLLKAATSLGLCAERKSGVSTETHYGLGMLGAALIGNPGVTSMIKHHKLLYRDLADPVDLLRGVKADGQRKETALSTFWPYAIGETRTPSNGSDKNPTTAYSALMSASQSLIVEDIFEVYPFKNHKMIMDIGGGDGTFLLAVAHHAPSTKLILFDLPQVAEQAHKRFEAEQLSGRAIAVGGDASVGPLPEGADLITLVRILHDHDDDKALAILRQVRLALPAGGTLLIAEPMAGVKGAEPVGDAYFGFYLLAMGSGRARRPEELREMLKQAGFNDVSTLRTRRPLLTGAIRARVNS